MPALNETAETVVLFGMMVLNIDSNPQLASAAWAAIPGSPASSPPLTFTLNKPKEKPMRLKTPL
ncbi:MAG: hypothetical protein PVJ53_18570, partial [Desulfobacterales bacterium]